MQVETIAIGNSIMSLCFENAPVEKRTNFFSATDLKNYNGNGHPQAWMYVGRAQTAYSAHL